MATEVGKGVALGLHPMGHLERDPSQLRRGYDTETKGYTKDGIATLMGFDGTYRGSDLLDIWELFNATKGKNIGAYRRYLFARMKQGAYDHQIQINQSIYVEQETVKAIVKLRFNPGKGVSPEGDTGKPGAATTGRVTMDRVDLGDNKVFSPVQAKATTPLGTEGVLSSKGDHHTQGGVAAAIGGWDGQMSATLRSRHWWTRILNKTMDESAWVIWSMRLASAKVISQRCHVSAGQTANPICAGAAHWAGVCSPIVNIGRTADTLIPMTIQIILRRKWFTCLPKGFRHRHQQEGGRLSCKEAKTRAEYPNLTLADAKGSRN